MSIVLTNHQTKESKCGKNDCLVLSIQDRILKWRDRYFQVINPLIGLQHYQRPQNKVDLCIIDVIGKSGRHEDNHLLNWCSDNPLQYISGVVELLLE